MTNWKFYGRRDELEAIKALLSRQRWFFCAISGRRRIGKTSLIREALQETRFGATSGGGALYLQVPDSDERDVVAVFADALEAFADACPGYLPETLVSARLRRFSDMARAIGALCHAGIVVVIDEFQYFNRKSLSPFTSLLQAEVDALTGSTRGGIFVLGSIHTELAALIERYRLVERLSPVFAPPSSRQARYQIGDNFLATWLAAIEPAVQAARVQPFEQALKIGELRLANHEGHRFERMIRKLMAEASRRGVADFPLTDLVHGYWNRPRDAARLIEIDIVAVNEVEERVRFGSCKRSSGKHSREALATFEQHIGDFLVTASGRRFKSWRHERALYSPEFPDDERRALQARGYVCVDLYDYRRWLKMPTTN